MIERFFTDHALASSSFAGDSSSHPAECRGSRRPQGPIARTYRKDIILRVIAEEKSIQRRQARKRKRKANERRYGGR